MRFTEEDKEMVARLIRGFEHDLEELRHDQYGHSEIVSDLKESCREKIGWLETFQKRMEQEQAETRWKSVDEWPKDGEPILMKLDNGKYQYSEWEDDGKGFNEGFAEINFGSGAMMRLPITYKVVAWRPLADVINELSDHGFISTQDNPILSKRLVDCDLSVRTLNICHANGIETLGDLTKLHKTDWLKYRNGGKKSLIELDDLLEAHGLTWKQWEG